MQIHEVSEVTTQNIKLTVREADICDLIVKGMTSKLIAQQLGISHRTVDTHAQRIRLKYDVRSRRELMRVILSGETEK